MKAEIDRPPTPLTLTLTFADEKEAAAFAAVMKHHVIDEFLHEHGVEAPLITNLMEDERVTCEAQGEALEHAFMERYRQTNESGEQMKTPAEWAKEDGIRILDPDGWRGATKELPAKDFNEPLTKLDYSRRVVHSTIQGTIRGRITR